MADLSDDELQELIRLCFPAPGEWDEAKCALRLHVSAPRLLSELQRRRASDAVRDAEREELARLRSIIKRAFPPFESYGDMTEGEIYRRSWNIDAAKNELQAEARRCHEAKGGA